MKGLAFQQFTVGWAFLKGLESKFIAMESRGFALTVLLYPVFYGGPGSESTPRKAHEYKCEALSFVFLFLSFETPAVRTINETTHKASALTATLYDADCQECRVLLFVRDQTNPGRT